MSTAPRSQWKESRHRVCGAYDIVLCKMTLYNMIIKCGDWQNSMKLAFWNTRTKKNHPQNPPECQTVEFISEYYDCLEMPQKRNLSYQTFINHNRLLLSDTIKEEGEIISYSESY